MGDLSGTRSWLPDSEVPRRYAEVSKDFSAIHLDEEVARHEGLPGVILHGMHIFGQVVGILDREAGRTHLTRARMRFADVAVPGEPIDITLVPDENGVAFQGAQGGRIILTSGRASFEEPFSVPH
jgi:acyl dehydratase